MFSRKQLPNLAVCFPLRKLFVHPCAMWCQACLWDRIYPASLCRRFVCSLFVALVALGIYAPITAAKWAVSFHPMSFSAQFVHITFRSCLLGGRISCPGNRHKLSDTISQVVWRILLCVLRTQRKRRSANRIRAHNKSSFFDVWLKLAMLIATTSII